MKYICTVCEYIYDPELGDPESGIEPGTAFEDIPDDWVCPLCGVGKEDFEPYALLCCIALLPSQFSHLPLFMMLFSPSHHCLLLLH